MSGERRDLPENRETERGPDLERGRVQAHARGIGAPSEEQLEQRAREIARTEERTPDQVTPDDRERALRELTGQTIEVLTDDAESRDEAARDPGRIASDTGREHGTIRPEDEQLGAEEMTREGVREAEHERMVESREPEDRRD